VPDFPSAKKHLQIKQPAFRAPVPKSRRARSAGQRGKSTVRLASAWCCSSCPVGSLGGGLRRVRNILGSRALQNVFRSVTMRGKQDPSFANPAFVSLGFVFGDSHSHQRSGEAAHRPTDANPCQSRHDWTCRGEWAYSRNRQRTNAHPAIPTLRQRPSGAFVAFTVSKSRLPADSGTSTATSVLAKLSSRNIPTAFSTRALRAVNSEYCFVFGDNFTPSIFAA
jgi:hypothetical protein